MVREAYSNIDVRAWLHQGRLGKSPSSICLFHSSTQAGSSILEAILELESGCFPARRSLTFQTRGDKSLLEKLRLTLVAESDDLRVIHIALQDKVLEVTLTPLGLPVLKDGVTAWLAGAEDFGISPRRANLGSRDLGQSDRNSLELWFWGPVYAGP